MKDPLFRHEDEKKIIEKISNMSDREIQEKLSTSFYRFFLWIFCGNFHLFFRNRSYGLR